MYIRATTASETINFINHIWASFNEFSGNVPYFVKFAGKSHPVLTMEDTLSILGKNVKEHLKNTCLNLRNSCGHPSSLKVGKHTVEAHIEFLVQNVFAVF